MAVNTDDATALVIKHAYPRFTPIVDDVLASATFVDQQIADISTTPIADGIPRADGAAKIDVGWLPDSVTRRLTEQVRKGTAGTIPSGKSVYVTGYNPAGGYATVELSDADDSAKMPALGVTDQPITDTATVALPVAGIISGSVTNPIDTSTWPALTPVYVSGTPGALQSTPPGNELWKVQRMGTVLYQHATDGVILLVGAGRENDVPNLNRARVFIGGLTNDAIQHEFPLERPFIPRTATLSGATLTQVPVTGLDVLAFADGVTDMAWWTIAPPHSDVYQGVQGHLDLYWASPGTAGNVAWKFQAECWVHDAGAAVNAAGFNATQQAITDNVNTVAWRLRKTTFTFPYGKDWPFLWAQKYWYRWKISRDGASDTNNDTAYLLGMVWRSNNIVI